MNFCHLVQHRSSVETAVGLLDQLAKAEREKQELQKALRKAEDMNKKLKKSHNVPVGYSISQPQLPGETRQAYAERLYREEQGLNEVCHF